MKKENQKVIIKAYLIYIFLLLILFIFLKLNKLILRQYLKIILEIISISAFLYILIINVRKRPEDSKKKKIIKGVLLLLLTSFIFFLIFFKVTFSDKESIAIVEGKKKIKIERSFIMYYEVIYCDYSNPVYYKAFPCIREAYDDGSPDDLIYIDYYDENGNLLERVFVDKDN